MTATETPRTSGSAPDADDLEAFRQRCRAFLTEHATEAPSGRRDAADRGARSLAVAREFQRELTDAGLAGLTYPVEYGGQGLTTDHERVWRGGGAPVPPVAQSGRAAGWGKG